MSWRSEISDLALDFLSRKYKRKIIVIESDDWGSVRLHSRKDYEALRKSRLLIEDAFLENDTLESDEDLERLFNMLSGIKNDEGITPKFTANFIMSNPNFNRIKEAEGERYFYRSLEDTYALSETSQGCKEIFDRAIAANLVQPEFHGREHVNVDRWMRYLNKFPEYREALRYNSYVVKRDKTYAQFGNTVAALDIDHPEDLEHKKKQTLHGLHMFREHFGFTAQSFVAPNYIWNNELHPVLKEMGIKSIQTSRFQNIPKMNKSGYKRKFHWTGDRNGFYFSVRNVVFEPVLYANGSNDYVSQVMNRIGEAFKYGNIANIGTHRVNYVSGMQKNLTPGLEALSLLLHKIIDKWPDVSFSTSRELIESNLT